MEGFGVLERSRGQSLSDNVHDQKYSNEIAGEYEGNNRKAADQHKRRVSSMSMCLWCCIRSSAAFRACDAFAAVPYEIVATGAASGVPLRCHESYDDQNNPGKQ